MSRVAYLQQGRCPDCGKWRYRSRRGAKTAGRELYPTRRMHAYRCRGWFHFSSTAPVRPSQASRRAAEARTQMRRAAA